MNTKLVEMMDFTERNIIQHGYKGWTYPVIATKGENESEQLEQIH